MNTPTLVPAASIYDVTCAVMLSWNPFPSSSSFFSVHYLYI
ncbi:unnamed protein product [Arabidopsis thaliana]|uniref:Uncharacterized protein n=4 Tax=Arabidopsis TaxID=3701 RepID=A0A654FX55_ARATH|nr:uncharacterized protein AT4G38401 [Arabidopsis thaliana]KAG7618867.1 hypothetical protein ISN45_At04g040790 [Arabidopsis thaliana x Arabidopsis arenosa]KAG7623341.1 hypothetical protein ISN44_As04g040500 [Arabidopsis suecica]AEE86924.1 hypothetical protein AT4G38401 [Arabidopsis thaliana]CAA0397902.1 unnamed protein product [Arabidopsis thaliana]VYS65294.1 unnamed protein product [Arabidopsis thaliana]|eukprot:NP_001119138.1 hypothetical protein AT4G38401 [Arabidopsis thaliana]